VKTSPALSNYTHDNDNDDENDENKQINNEGRGVEYLL